MHKTGFCFICRLGKDMCRRTKQQDISITDKQVIETQHGGKGKCHSALAWTTANMCAHFLLAHTASNRFLG